MVEVALETAVTDQELRVAAGCRIARYKVPKEFVRVDRIERTATGKADYGWARRIASEAANQGVR